MENATIQNMTSLAVIERKIHYYFMEIGVPTVCAFGLVGNILNLIVLTREKIHCSLTKMEKSAHIGLIALAVSDFLFCLLALLFTILPIKGSYTELNPVLYYQWLGGSFITIFIITSTWLIVVMAGERYIAVCHPFKARNLISLKRTRITIMLVYIVCICSTIPLFFENVITTLQCENGGLIYTVSSRQGYGQNAVWIRRIIWASLFDFVPSVALLFFNTCLIFKIHKAKQIRNQMTPCQRHDYVLYRSRDSSSYSNIDQEYTQLTSISKSSLSTRSQNGTGNDKGRNGSVSTGNRNEIISTTKRNIQHRLSSKPKKKSTDHALNSVTATLVAVVVFFLILVSPSEILKFLYSKLSEKSAKPNYTYQMIKHITNFMQSLNFSFNFVLYCAVNKSFRDTLARLFCPRKKLFNFKTLKMTGRSTPIQELS